MYGGLLVLCYILQQQVVPLEHNLFLVLAMDLVAFAGLVVGLRGSYRGAISKTGPESMRGWERYLTVLVVLTFAVPVISAWFRQSIVNGHTPNWVKTCGADVYAEKMQQIVHQSEEDAKTTGVMTFFDVISGRTPNLPIKLDEIRDRLRSFSVSLDRTQMDTESYLRACRDPLPRSDPTAIILESILKKLPSSFSLKRQYYSEVGLLIEFLIAKKATYELTAEGVRFQNQQDANFYNAAVDRLVDYERQVAAVATEIKSTKAQ